MEESMAKIKVHELAKELELQSKDILSFYRKKELRQRQHRARWKRMRQHWYATASERKKQLHPQHRKLR